MTPTFTSQVIRILVALTIPFSTPAFAAGIEGGGDGSLPPASGPGDDSAKGIENEMGKSFGGPEYRPIAGTFREVFATLEDGTVVYREGTIDSRSRVRVFKYYSAASSDVVYRGYVVQDSKAPNGYRIEFPTRWTMRYDRLLRVLFDAGNLTAMEKFIGPPAPIPASHASGNLLDGYRMTVSGGTYLVYFQGRQDAFGREIVMRPTTIDGKINPLSYRVGVLNSNGLVEWRPGFYSRDMIIAELSDPKINFGRTNGWGQPDTELFQGRLKLFKEYTAEVWESRIKATTPIQQRMISPHSNYPEVAAPKDPLPANRSLTVIRNQGVTTTPFNTHISQPGNSGMNVPQQEYLAEMDPAYKPSRVAQTLQMTREQLAQFKENLRKMIRGERNMFIGEGGMPGSGALEKIKNGGIQFGRGAAGFYIAMGMMAGVMLMTQYPENPMAWDQLVESLATPSGVAQTAGFMAVAGGTYWGMKRLSVKAFGPSGPTKFGVGGTLFMSSILMGALAGTIISELMADPNSGKCIGDVTFRLFGKFEPNQAACDAFWDKWSSNEYWNNLAVTQLMPMFANIMVAGGLYQAAMMGTHYLLSRQFMLTALRSVKIGWSAKGGMWVQLIGLGIQGGLFLGAYWISDQIFGIGQWVKEFMTAEWSFSNDPNGNSIRDNKNKLLTVWRDLKKTDFKNPNVFKNVCFDPDRSYDMFYDCDNPKGMGPEALILKYGMFQQAWRRIQMTDVENAYNQWRKKSDNYYAMLEVSYDFYKGAVDRMMFEKRAKTPAEAQAAGFNQGYLDVYVAVQDAIGTDVWKYTKDRGYNGWWKYVETTSIADFLVTSMACGPEAEGYGGEPDDWMTGTLNWLSGNTAPPLVVDNPTGWETRFFAPRLVKPVDDYRNTACEFGGNRNPVNAALGNEQVSTSQVQLVSPSGKYAGVFEYIKAEIRNSIIDGDTNNFQKWWETNITPGTVALEKEFRSDYKKMLEDHYMPALTNDEYRRGWCGPSFEYDGDIAVGEIITGFEPILKRLGKDGEPCPADATHRLANGILNSLRDEMRLYFAMLIDLYVTKRLELGTRPSPKEAKVAEDTAIAKAKEMLDLMDGLLASAKELDPAKRVNLQEAVDKFSALSLQSKKDYLARQFPNGPLPPDERGQPQPDPAPPVNPHLERWAFLLGQRIDSVFLETVILMRILTTFEQK